MGAGISQKDLRKRLYNALKSQQRELMRAGIPTLYKNLQLYPDVTNIPIPNRIFFSIRYNVLRASNGESAAMRYVTILHPDGSEQVFGKDWDANKGIERIKELYARLETEADEADDTSVFSQGQQPKNFRPSRI